MTGAELAAKAKDVATNYDTAYMLGCFGWPATEANISRAVKNNTTNASRKQWQSKANAIIGKGFLFDCVCLIKAILWGWNGDATKSYGGAKYASNGVPDIGADQMINVCKDVSTDFSVVVPGEAVWLKGHIGIYIGDGLAVECTPAFKSGVQITAVSNMGTKIGYSARKWTKHGKLPYVTYGAEPVEPSTPAKSDGSIAIGTEVQFSGKKHYATAVATAGVSCKPGKATVTAIAAGKAHPYHVVKIAGGGSTVYGWVDATDIEVAVFGTAYKVVPTSGLNIRSGPGKENRIVTAIPFGTVVRIDKTLSGWGHLSDGRGWCSMAYLKEV